MNHMHEVGKTVERYLSFMWKNIRHEKITYENSLNPDERSPFFFQKIYEIN